MGKPVIHTKCKINDETHIVEVFKTNEAFIIHKHMFLTEQDYNKWLELEKIEPNLKVFQEVRKFWNKYYCTQWTFVSKNELNFILENYDKRIFCS